MHILRQRSFKAAMLSFAFFLGACGDGTEADAVKEKCSQVEGDRHLAGGQSEPDAIKVMVHIIGRECLVTGENRMGLYEVGSTHDDEHAPHGAYRPAHAITVDHLKVTAVRATMPSMGHGTAQKPKLHGDSQFTVNFQMPGEWKLEVEFASPNTTAAQTATFDVRVQ